MKYTFSIFFAVLLLLFCNHGQVSAQSIAVDVPNFNTGHYGAGGSITVPIKLNGNFSVNDQFLLYLSNAAGTFATGTTLIGGYNTFFSPFVNGTLPKGLSGTTYKLKVVLDSANSLVFAVTPAFSISGSGDTVANLTEPINSSLIINDTTFGECSASNYAIDLQATNGQTLDISSLILDSAGNAQINTDASSPPLVGFNATPGNYYTVQAVVKNADHTLSIRSFLVMDSYANNNFGQGPSAICIPNAATATLAIANNTNHGILNNYPGTIYSINWGDSTTTSYTHDALVAQAGIFSHVYDSTSCTQPPINIGGGQYLYNAFNGLNTDSTINCPVKNMFHPNNVHFNVSQSPKAIVDSILVFCTNDSSLTICGDSSQPGVFADPNNAGGCTIPTLTYQWTLNGKRILISQDSSCFTVPLSQLINGINTVTLTVNNGSCTDETTKKFCYSSTRPVPNFLVNGFDSISHCAPDTVRVTNQTAKSSYCNLPITYNFYVTDSNYNVLTAGVDYQILSIHGVDSLVNPVFYFTNPNKYYIHLTFQDACTLTGNVDSTVRIVNLIGTGAVSIPNTQRYCGLDTINFATNPKHTPTYNSNQGNEQYSWTVTGGAYKFVGGTTATSRYPQIWFESYATYNVKIVFINTCGTDSATQTIVFNQPLTVMATPGSHDTAVCYSTNSLQLNGAKTGPVDSVYWVTNGTGNFSNRKIVNPVYGITGADKTNDSVQLIITAYPIPPSACPAVSDTMNVVFKPNNVGTDTTVTICTGSALDYQPVSSVDTSKFTWLASLAFGTVTGYKSNAAPNSLPIKDILANPSNSDSGVVKYNITPTTSDGCTGPSYTLTAIVDAIPTVKLSLPKDTVCSGTDIALQITGTLKRMGITYQSSVVGAATGNTSQTTIINEDTTIISDVLVNTSGTNSTVTYIIQPYGVQTTSCPGKPDTIKIVVLPGASAAIAGPNQTLCNDSTATLQGNAPTSGVGMWSQTSPVNPKAKIVSHTTPTTTVNGLVPGNTYTFVWTISAVTGCGSSDSAVTIIDRPPVTKAVAGDDTTICTYTEGTPTTIAIKGNLNASRPYETGSWLILSPVGSTASISPTSQPTANFSFSSSGIYQLQWTISDSACTPSMATITINVYDSPVAGAVSSGDTSICAGQSATISLGGFTGNIEQWQYKRPYKNGAWKDTAVTNPTVTFNNIQDTFWARAVVVSTGFTNGCLDGVITDSILIMPAPTTNPGKTSGNDTVCGGGNSGVITLKSYVGSIIKWQYSTDYGNTWVDTANTTNRQPYGALTSTRWYRAVVQSGSCASLFSDTAIITVSGFATQPLTGPTQRLCNDTTAFTLQGNNPAAGETGVWTQTSGPVATITSPGSPTTTVTAIKGLKDSVYVFAWTINNKVCPATSATDTIYNRPIITKANAGKDSVLCSYTEGTLVIIPLQANADTSRHFETGIWNIIAPSPTSATVAPTNDTAALFTFKQSGLYILQWTINNDANCPSSVDTVRYSVYDSPSASQPFAADTNACSGQDVTVNLPQFTGVIEKWQFKQPIGSTTWQDVANTTSTITFPGVLQSFWVRAVVVSAGADSGCNAIVYSDSLKINVAPPVNGGTVSRSDTVCGGSNSGTLTVSGYVGSIVKWQKDTTANFTSWTDIADTSKQLTYTNLATTTWYRVVVQSGSCFNTYSDAAIITVLGHATKANAGGNDSLCGATSTVLNGNKPATGETGLWTQLLPVSPVVTGMPASTPTVTVSGLSAGTAYAFEWTITNNFCPASHDTANIVIYNALTNSIVDTAVTVCYGVPVTISGVLPTGSTGSYSYDWQWKPLGGTWGDFAPNITTQSITFTPVSTGWLRRIVYAGPCSAISDSVLVTVQPSLSNNTIAQDQSICTNTAPAPLVGSVPLGGNGSFSYSWQWDTVGSPNGFQPINNSDTKDYQPPVLTVTTQYRRIVSTALCSGLQASISDTVTITVNPNAKAQFTALKDTGCSPFLIDSNNIKATDFTDRNGSYEWFANNMLIGTGLAFPGYTIATDNASVQIKLMVISKFGCLSDSMQQTFYTFEKPNPSFTPIDTSACTPPGGFMAVTYVNTTPDKDKFTYVWNFGNIASSTLADPGTINFPTNAGGYGTIVYYDTMWASNGCVTNMYTGVDTVKSTPEALFSANKTIGCSSGPITFTNLSVVPGSPTQYTWYFGIGDSLATNNKTVQYVYHNSQATTYSVTLTGTNECGTHTSPPLSITIDSSGIGLYVNINSTDKYICTGDSVHFQNKSSGATSFTWNFGDGTFITTTNNIETVPHQYNYPGVYYDTVCAINACADTCTNDSIKVGLRPVASFKVAPDSICTGGSVQFTNTSTPLSDAGVLFTWKFGDNTFDNTTLSPAHVYAASGTYTAWLVADRQFTPGFPAGFGCPDSASAIIYVGQPTGTLQYSPDTACQMQPVTFTVVSNNATTYNFSFGDNTNLVTNNNTATHIYNQPGKYLPFVTITGFGGKCSTTITGADSVLVDSVQASFTVDSVPLCGSTKIIFTSTSYAYFGIKSYQWVLDRTNTNFTGNADSTVFTNVGSHELGLTVAGNSGCQSQIQQLINVNVHQAPIDSISVNSTACAGQTVYFSATAYSNDLPMQYYWIFGNGYRATGPAAKTSFSPAGTYADTLIATSSFGCTDTVTGVVNISTTPRITITPQDTVILCLGITTQLKALGDSIVTWSWTPVNGLSCDSCGNTLASPTATTLYTVSGTNTAGCTGSDSVTVYVVQPFTVTATPDSVSICLPEDTLQHIQFFASGAYSYTWSPTTWLNDATVFNPVVNIPLSALQTSTKVVYTVTGHDQYQCFTNSASVTLNIGLQPTVDFGTGGTGVAGRIDTLFPITETNGPFSSFTWSVSGPGVVSPNALGDTVQLTINGDITVYVTAVNNFGCSVTDTLHFSAFCNQGEQVYIPNAFSPDGDGINDVFMVEGRGITVKSLKIFNRWGQEVFDGGSNFPPGAPAYGWDGTIHGQKATEDVYVYVAELKCTASDISFFQKGNVTLIRVRK
jgi:gliding motility-associated-like protein